MNNKRYGIDTVALLAYFADVLGIEGNKLFKEAESLNSLLIVPEIVIGEAIYIIMKGRTIFGKKTPSGIQNTLIQTLFHSSMFIVTPMTITGWQLFQKSSLSELHDRMIVATCIQEKVSLLITTDEEINKSSEITTIW